jgi:hypothetical protein
MHITFNTKIYTLLTDKLMRFFIPVRQILAQPSVGLAMGKQGA